MGQVRPRTRRGTKRLLKLIRAFLNAGVMENGLVSPSVEGTPQGGPHLRPLLSNLVLDRTRPGVKSAEDIASFDMRMTVISTFAASGRVNE